MSNEEHAYSYETVRGLMHYRDIEIARMSAELAALKMSHDKLADIARAVIQLDGSANSMDVVSEGIRPIACDARDALKRFRESNQIIQEVRGR